MLEQNKEVKQLIENLTNITSKSESIDNTYTNFEIIADCGTINCMPLKYHLTCYIIRKPYYAKTTFACFRLKHFNKEFYTNRLFDKDLETVLL